MKLENRNVGSEKRELEVLRRVGNGAGKVAVGIIITSTGLDLSVFTKLTLEKYWQEKDSRK